MNTVERFRAAFRGAPADRVPVCGWLGMPWLQRRTGKTILGLLQELVAHPLAIVEIQEALGLDPIVVTVDERWFSMHNYWRLLYSWPAEALRTWQVTQAVTETGAGFVSYQFTADTPGGPIVWSYQVGEGQVSELERPIKDEADLDRLAQYLPTPESLNQDKLGAMVTAVGDRGFFTHNFIGVWGEAANLRGLVALCADLFERPNFVHQISEFLTTRAIRRVRHLTGSGVHSLLYDQSWVGIGFSPQVYREFMLPYDRQVVQAARDAGLLVSYHNCGRGTLFLEDMVSTGADALDTLTPKLSSGDFDLADVKRRVGQQITLNGGFNERILATASPAEVRDQAKRCLDAAGGDGRYILRTCGQIFDAAPGTIETFAETGREYGRL